MVCGIGLFFLVVFLLLFNSDLSGIKRNLKLAQRSLVREDYKRAIDAFEAVIEKDPRNTDAYIGLAKAYVETGDLEKAVRLLERRAKRSDSEEIQRLLELYKVELAQRDTSQQGEQEVKQGDEAIQNKEILIETKTSENSQQPELASSEPNPQPEATVIINKGFVSQDGELYYYDELGSIVFGWIEFGGSRYYAGSDGRLYRNGEYEIDSVKYLFDVSGICIREIRDEAWKQAYIDYIRKNCFEDCAETLRYWLIYINDDDIPEVVWIGDREGVAVMTFSDGTIDVRCGDGFSYIKKRNLFRISEGASLGEGGFEDVIYCISDGKMATVFKGECEFLAGDYENGVRINEATTIGYNVIGENEVWDFQWNGVHMTRQEYESQLLRVYNCDEADEMTNEPYYSYGQIFDVIANY